MKMSEHKALMASRRQVSYVASSDKVISPLGNPLSAMKLPLESTKKTTYEVTKQQQMNSH